MAELEWITEEGTALFRPKHGPIEIPALHDLPVDYHELVPLYEEGLLDVSPMPWGMPNGIQCTGCDAGGPHPATRVMIFDADDSTRSPYTNSYSNLLYRLAESLGWEYEEFQRAITLRSSQFLWLMRHLSPFFRESIHPLGDWGSGMHCLFFSDTGSARAGTWGLFYLMASRGPYQGILRRWLDFQYFGRGHDMAGAGRGGESSCTMVLPLSPAASQHA